MIKIKVIPVTEAHRERLGEAIVTLDVNSATAQARPVIESGQEVLGKAISFKVLLTPHDPVGHIVDPDRHTGATLMHNLHAWNEFKAYKFEVEEGEDFLKAPPTQPLPEGAIP